MLARTHTQGLEANVSQGATVPEHTHICVYMDTTHVTLPLGTSERKITGKVTYCLQSQGIIPLSHPIRLLSSGL